MKNLIIESQFVASFNGLHTDVFSKKYDNIHSVFLETKHAAK